MSDASEPDLSGSRTAELLSDASLGGRRLQISAPQVLYESQAAAQNAYFLEAGQIRIYLMGPQNVARLADILGPGAWIGVAALAGEAVYGDRAEVVSPSIVWELGQQRLRQWISTQPQVAADLIAQLARRLRAAHETAAGLVFNDCNQRLISTLLKFSDSAAATQNPQGVVLHITHQELAQAVGAARETISLALTQLRQQNLLKTGRNRLTFNPQVLKSFSQRLERQQGRPDVQTGECSEKEKAV